VADDQALLIIVNNWLAEVGADTLSYASVFYCLVEAKCCEKRESWLTAM